MTQTEQQIAARKFIENWSGVGYEKGDTAKFWIDLLSHVFGINDFTNFVYFEDQVKSVISDKNATNFIDVYIPSTKVMIEQKSLQKDLRTPILQSDKTFLTPFQQARKYIAGLPVSQHPKWVVTCNFRSFLVYDMENPNSEPQEIFLENLEKEYYRLSFIVDTGNVHLQKEMELSIQAGKIVGDIYDALLAQYNDHENPSDATLRSLNMLCVRLVFCLYAEDAGIFGHKSMFGDYLKQFPAKDLRRALLDLFKVLDQDPDKKERDEYLEESLAAFPYVNGGLFTEEDATIPQLTEEIKDLLVNKSSDDFNWSEISPTIFGAIFESTLNQETRRSGGMHYTSIENIHKVIDPLFLNKLNEEFEEIVAIKAEKIRLEKAIQFQKKLGALKFLDPACGSGNFLTESYLSLRRLENKCLRLRFKDNALALFDDAIYVSIHQFYGIEINDFATVVAKTALWIAESQMMEETSRILGQNLDFLPLKTYSNIVEGNALKMDWRFISESNNKIPTVYAKKTNLYITGNENELSVGEPKIQYGEINLYTENLTIQRDSKAPEKIPTHYDYIMGNPPFVGHQWRSESQVKDMDIVFSDFDTYGKLDYVAAWYKKAADLIQSTNTLCAFVSTNSICQGESVSVMWKPLFEKKHIHINFAYKTFRWDSESTQKAHVHCVIIGFSNTQAEKKFIFNETGIAKDATNINGYLLDAPNIFIQNRSSVLTPCLPKMSKGSQPTDGGNLILSKNEREQILSKYPTAEKLIKRYISADDYINNNERFCLWLKDISPAEYRNITPIKERLIKVVEMRKASPTKSVQRDAETPMLFTQIRQPETTYLVVPEVSSERRRYIPIGFIEPTVICSNMLYIIPNASLYMFGMLISNVHMSWMRVVCGRLKSDYRYTPAVYNNFPWPTPTDEQKQKIEQTAQAILDARANYLDASLADLYDETTMPSDLRKAHQANDKAVMNAFCFPVKMTESECVAELFKMYEKLVEEK